MSLLHWLASKKKKKKKATPFFPSQPPTKLPTLTSSPQAVSALPSGRAAMAPPEKKGSTADSRRHEERLGEVDVDAIGFYVFCFSISISIPDFRSVLN
jgi:hypothetical protein